MDTHQILSSFLQNMTFITPCCCHRFDYLDQQRHCTNQLLLAAAQTSDRSSARINSVTSSKLANQAPLSQSYCHERNAARRSSFRIITRQLAASAALIVARTCHKLYRSGQHPRVPVFMNSVVLVLLKARVSIEFEVFHQVMIGRAAVDGLCLDAQSFAYLPAQHR
jgi:hypothetical protein